MNILMLSDFWPTSGNPISGVFVQEQVEEYQKQGHQVTVIVPVACLRGAQQRPYMLRYAGAVVYSPNVLIPPGLSYIPPTLRVYCYRMCLTLYARAISRVIRDHIDMRKIDGVHVNGLSFSGSAIPHIQALHGKKIVVSVLGEDPLIFSMISTHLFRNIISRACQSIGLVVLCGTPLRKYVKALGIPTEKTGLIPNGTFIPSDFKSMSESDCPKVISISNLEEHKNISANILALSSLRDVCRFTYTVVGDGTQRSYLEQFAKAHGISERVRFVGRVDHKMKMDLLSDADIFCLPSIRDAFPIVFLEAMVRRKPAIGGLGTGVEDIIEHGVNGFLVNPRDPRDIALALEKLIGDPALRQRMGNKAFETACRYSWANNVKKYVELFEGVRGNLEEMSAGGAQR